MYFTYYIFKYLEPKTIQLKGGEIAHRSRTFSYVRNLKPYTTYMITVALVTSIGEGMPSDPLFKTTLEGGKCSSNNFRILRFNKLIYCLLFLYIYNN